MGTKNNSSGSQFTPRGVNQGISLVAHESGLPIDSVVDAGGIRRLAVDSNVTIDNAVVNVDLESDTDNVAIRNTANDNELLIESDGSITIRLKDEAGVAFSAANPLPVQIISGTGIDVEVDAADGDNIAIHDNEGHELEINPDGSINVVFTAGAGGTPFSFFDEVTGVAAATLTTIATFTVPALTTLKLYRIEVSGSNVATYEIYVNTVIQGRRRTWFNGNMSEEFEFPVSGLVLAATDTIDVKVIHSRPTTGDFEARLHGETL